MTNLEKTTTKNPSIWLALIYQRKKNNSITNLVAIQNLQPSLWMLSHFSHVRLFVMLWTVAHQAPLSMGFSRQEYWSGLPCPPPGDLPHSGIKPTSLCLLHWQAGSLPSPLGSPCPTPAWLQKPGCSLDSQPSLWPPALAHGRRSVNTYWKKE